MDRGNGERSASELGLRLIIVYKLAKAAGELVLALTLIVVLRAGGMDEVGAFALELRSHVAGAWSVGLSDLLLQAAVPHYVELTTLALSLDGMLTLLEGWALYRAFPWAPWLVVIATASLLPFEVVALARHIRAGRLLILLVNLAVVTYLGIRARRESEARLALH